MCNNISMKKTEITILFIMALGFFMGCEKYDEGGYLSRADKTITDHMWIIQTATDLEESVDITADYAGEVWEFTEEDKFKINSSLEGTYAFSDDMLTLTITETDGGVDSYRIERLDDEAMWLLILGEEELKFVPY
jgi:hypothetical protein